MTRSLTGPRMKIDSNYGGETMKSKPTTRTGKQLALQTQHQTEEQQDELTAILKLVRHDPLDITADMQERAEQPELKNYWIARLPDGKTTRKRVGPNRGPNASAIDKRNTEGDDTLRGVTRVKMKKERKQKSSASLGEAKLNWPGLPEVNRGGEKQRRINSKPQTTEKHELTN